MKTVVFHFNVAAPVPYLCRLLRKASHAGQRTWVLLAPALAHELDAALWTFSPDEFIAHGRYEADHEGGLGGGESAGAKGAAGRGQAGLWQRAPVVLSEQLVAQSSSWPLLINLQEPVPPDVERFERLIEIVPADEALKQAARLRWRHYSQLGWTLQHHDASA